MCTVSIIPFGDAGFRLIGNRDERRSRPIASIPAIHRAGTHDAIFPTDPLGGGTWIGVNTAGLAVAMLNRYDEPALGQPVSPQSRGSVAIRALGCIRLEDVIRFASSLRPEQFAPFRLVAAQKREVTVVSSDGRAVDVERRRLAIPLMFTSSSLGDARVLAVRQELFQQLVGRRPERWLAGQSRFHNHRWSDCPELSVVMDRLEAATMSRSTIDVDATGVCFRYETLGTVAEAA
jgi:uncharacterized protein with NRDE domain